MNPTNEPIWPHGGPMTIKIGPVSNPDPEPEYSIRAAKELSEARERIEGLESVLKEMLEIMEFGLSDRIDAMNRARGLLGRESR